MSGELYGTAPINCGPWHLSDWHEFTHWLYLPVVLESSEVRLPPQLKFMHTALHLAMDIEREDYGNVWRYVYLTVRRGFASPDNPLNRPGWHTDGFGGEDINYIWSDK